MTAPNNASSMPAYLQRGGEQELVAPCGLLGSQFYVFLLQGKKANLQSLVDRLFNEPSGGVVKYEVLSDYVALMFTHVDQLTSSETSQGWAAYGDIAMWVPVIERSGLIPELKMYPVYMIVDNGSTMATGREVYGFPKEMGWFVEPQAPAYMGDFSVDVLGYEHGSATKQNVRSRLWTIQHTGHGKKTSFDPIDDIEKLIIALERDLKGLFKNLEAELIITINAFRNGFKIPALGLKQFRDIQNPGQAAFQSIVEAPLGLTRFHSARLLGDDFVFDLNDLATHPVADATGLQLGPQQVAYAFWLYGDFELGAGKTLWQHPAS